MPRDLRSTESFGMVLARRVERESVWAIRVDSSGVGAGRWEIEAWVSGWNWY